MNRKGIDISAHNGSVDMKKIKAEGIDFVMIRASYGNGHEDMTLKQYKEETSIFCCTNL